MATTTKETRIPSPSPKDSPTKAKYRNAKFVADGVTWDSKKEYARWLVLWRLKELGEITRLRRQERFPCVVNGQLVCVYVSDFSYVKRGERVVDDTKSDFTRKLPVYRIKCKLVKAVYGITIHEV